MRIDTDPSQASAWRNESSVRHVAGGDGGPGGGDGVRVQGGESGMDRSRVRAVGVV